jgi:hypothetical protein
VQLSVAVWASLRTRFSGQIRVELHQKLMKYGIVQIRERRLAHS